MQEVDSNISRDDLYFAYSTYSSRAFPVQIPQSDPIAPYTFKPKDEVSLSLPFTEAGLLPFGDIFNHSSDSDATYSCDSGALNFRLEFEPSTGKELFNNYGNKTNESFILSYGFFIPDNPHDSYWVQLAIHPNDPDRDAKIDLLNSSQYPMRYDLKKNSIPSEFYAAMRICLMNDQDLFIGRDTREPIHFKNEMLMLKSAASLVQGRLDRIKYNPISGTMDEKRSSMAIYYRQSQKEILENALKSIDQSKKSYISAKHSVLNEKREGDALINSWRIKHIPSDFLVDECVLQIPVTECIYRETILSSAFGKDLISNGLDEALDDDFLIMAYLIFSLYENESKHHIFAKLCKVSSIFSCQNSIEIMRNLGLCSELDYHLENIESYFRDFSSISSSVQTNTFGSYYTLDSFAWAYALLLSYGHELLIDDEEVLSILPFHSHTKYDPHSSYDCSYNNGVINVLATGKSPKNEFVLYHNFGNKDNISMLLEHGFIIPNNNFDKITINIELNEDDLTDHKIRLLETHYAQGPYIIGHYDIPKKLLLAARVAMMTKEDIDACHDVTDIVSDANEASAKSFLIRKLNEIYNQYTESSEVFKVSKITEYLSEQVKILVHNLKQLENSK